MKHEPDCCGTCPCGVVVHLDGVWPPNACSHGLAACEDHAPETCEDCAEDELRQIRNATRADEHGTTDAALTALADQIKRGAA